MLLPSGMCVTFFCDIITVGGVRSVALFHLNGPTPLEIPACACGFLRSWGQRWPDNVASRSVTLRFPRTPERDGLADASENRRAALQGGRLPAAAARLNKDLKKKKYN